MACSSNLHTNEAVIRFRPINLKNIEHILSNSSENYSARYYSFCLAKPRKTQPNTRKRPHQTTLPPRKPPYTPSISPTTDSQSSRPPHPVPLPPAATPAPSRSVPSTPLPSRETTQPSHGSSWPRSVYRLGVDKTAQYTRRTSPKP